MESPWNLDDLEIVGYANVLKETMLPSVVPPVFRLKTDVQRAFVPPYSFNAGFLCNATEVPQPELLELRDAGEITLFDEAFPAIANLELWIDQSFREHYEPRDEAQEKLRGIAGEAIKQAENALRRGDFQHAERLCGIAISADDRSVDALAIKAAIHRLDGNQQGEGLMAELASPFLKKTNFDRLVNDYCNSVSRAAPAVADCSARRSSMRDMALLRAA